MQQGLTSCNESHFSLTCDKLAWTSRRDQNWPGKMRCIDNIWGSLQSKLQFQRRKLSYKYKEPDEHKFVNPKNLQEQDNLIKILLYSRKNQRYEIFGMLLLTGCSIRRESTDKKERNQSSYQARILKWRRKINTIVLLQRILTHCQDASQNLNKQNKNKNVDISFKKKFTI